MQPHMEAKLDLYTSTQWNRLNRSTRRGSLHPRGPFRRTIDILTEPKKEQGEVDRISFEIHSQGEQSRGFPMAQTSMLHVRVDDKLKADAAEKLASFGLTVSDAVRILLTRVAKEGGLPAGLTAAPEAYDAWFRAKVQEALADTRSTVPHQHVMDEAQALIDRKRRAHS